MKPILSLDFINKLAIETGHTSNSDVFNFIRHLEKKLREDVDNKGFGIVTPPPNTDTPMGNLHTASSAREEAIKCDAQSHHEGCEHEEPKVPAKKKK